MTVLEPREGFNSIIKKGYWWNAHRAGRLLGGWGI